MPVAVTSLTSAQKRTLAFIAGAILLAGLSAAMLYDLSQRRVAAAAGLEQVRQKEIQAQSVQPVSASDLTEWERQESELARVLIADQDVPAFFEEITSIGAQNRIQPGITTDDKTIDPNSSPTPEELNLLALGIRRYMVMTITFRGEYPDTARFLSQVSALSRPVEFKRIDMRRSPPLVDVTMTMHVYKKEGA
jgi:Tfp pilus assembly protein PilO